MAWASDLLRSRVSFPIVFAGAAVTVALVRLTSLLPEQYYFRFSTLVSSDRSPFIVEPPGVTYDRFCNLVRKYRLGEGTFSLSLEGCARAAAQQTKATPEKLYGQKNESAIYRAVYANDESIRRTLEDAARVFRLSPLADGDIRAALTNAQSLEDAINTVAQRYQTETQQQFVALLRTQPDRFASIKSLLEALPPDEPPKAQPAQQPRIDDKGQAAFIRAVTASNANLTASLVDVHLEPISKRKLDEVLRYSATKDFVFEQLITHYLNQIADRHKAALIVNLKNEGIDTSRDKALLDKLIRDDATGAYIVSVAIRLAPVLAFGLVIGLAFGAREIASAALAAALAAFLLAWPVVLLWDNVVSYPWQDKRPIFYAFYVLYVLSFFIAARFAAGIGASVRGWLSLRDQSDAATVSGAGVGVGVLRDFTVALIVNALFYVGNALMVLT